MKKALLLLFLIHFTVSNSQINFWDNYYIDCLKSSYTMNYAISLSSPKGNFNSAKELLKNDYFNNHKFESALISSLLDYNTIGSKQVEEHLATSNLNKEQQDFVRLWISFYTKNFNAYQKQLAAFQEHYPSNYLPIKLRLRAILNYRDKSIWNQIKEKKGSSIATIDSLLQINTIDKEDRIYFSLLKLDFLNKADFRSTEEEVAVDDMLKELFMLYISNKSLFHLTNVKNKLNSSKSNSYKSTVAEITEEEDKLSNKSSTESALQLLLHYNNDSDKKMTVVDLESALKKLLQKEKKANDLHKLKALIGVYSLSREPDLGVLMKGMLKPIPFIKTFKQLYTITGTKASILANITSLLNEAQFKEIINETELTLRYKNEYNKIKGLSVEDLQAIYGIMVFSVYYGKSIKESVKSSFGNFQDVPARDNCKDASSYIAFLTQNPLYLNDSKYISNTAVLRTEAEMFKLIELTNELRQIYPGSSSLLNNSILSLAMNNKKVSEVRKEEYYETYYKLIIDYVSFSNTISIKEYDMDVNFFGALLNYNKEEYDNYFDYFYSLMNENGKTNSIAYLEAAKKNNPSNENLIYLNYTINKSKGGIAYLDSYLEAISTPNSYDKIDISLLAMADSTQISNRLKTSITLLKEKKYYNDLKKLLPLAYFLKEKNTAVDLVLFLLKNSSREQQFNDDFSINCLKELYTEFDEQDCIESLLIINKEVPDYEMSYLYLSILKLENEDRKIKGEGLALLKRYEEQSFPSSMGYLGKYYRLKNFFKKAYFKEENMNLVFKAILQKYPNSLEKLMD